MAIRYLPRPAAPRRAAALALGALLLLSPAAVAADRGEPAPPRPLPVYSQSLLDRPGTQVRPGSAAPRLPAVSALSWLVADAGTGEVLAARDAHRRLPPASTLKSLFALTALPRLAPQTRHTVALGELDGVGAGSSLVGVREGLTYRVADLWRGVFLSSGNDAVHVLARLNGGWRSTVRQMRAKARALGARDTHVVSPDGYDADGQVSSAYDLAVFGRAGLRDPQFARYCATPVARFPSGGWSYPIQNTNRLLTGADGVAPYPGLIGVKNGYTSRAGNTLISAARRGGRTLVVTVMNPQAGGHAVYEEARALLDWGFGAKGHVRPVGSLLPAPAKARTGPEPVMAAAALPADLDESSAWPAVLLVVAGCVVMAAGVVVVVARRRTAAPAERPAVAAEPETQGRQ